MSENMGSKNLKDNPFSEFFKKNKSLTVLLPVLIVGIIAVIILYSGTGMQTKPVSKSNSVQTPTPTPTKTQTKAPANIPGSSDLPVYSGNTVEVLPQMERLKQPEMTTDNQVRDPFSSGNGDSFLRLKGIALAEKKNTAIIETENRSFIVSAGDKIGSSWSVASIDENGVTVKDKEGNDIILKLN